MIDLLTHPLLLPIAAGLNVGALAMALAMRLRYGAIATRHTGRLLNIALAYLIVLQVLTGVPFEVRTPLFTGFTRVVALVGYCVLAWGFIASAGEAIALRRSVRAD